MQLNALRKMLVLLSSLTLMACQTNAITPPNSKNNLVFTTLDIKQKVQAAQLVQQDILNATGLTNANLLIATKKNGLLLLDKSGKTLTQLAGHYTSLDHRPTAEGLLVASVDGNLQQAIVASFSKETQVWSKPLALPKPNFKIEDACLYQDHAKNTYVFLVGEEGLGQQWLVGEAASLRNQALLVRNLSLPPASSVCQVDDTTNTLYVNEENVGLWAYQAHPEAELARKPIAMLKPFGDIADSATAIALADEHAYLLDTEHGKLHQYTLNKNTVGPLPSLDISTLKNPERISVRTNVQTTELLVQDDNGLNIVKFSTSTNASSKTATLSTPDVKPLIQSDLMPSLGDAADDPAIWIHPKDATKSVVLGTDKQGGLAVYNLQGKQLQYLAVGRLNNVDVRSGFQLDGKLIDLAVASNRDHNSLHLFAIDQETGQVTALNQLATSINDMYGICLFKDKKSQFFAIVNDKDGRFEQYQLSENKRNIVAKKVRSFSVASQPEGCVVDDVSEQLFVGEEDVAVWALNANADAPATLRKVIGVGEAVHADIEGIAFYRGGKNGTKNNYIVFSSQGNDRYVVLEATPPYKMRGVFSVGMHAQLGIDGASETDGLEVTSEDLSGNHTGPWRLGMLVVQDGRKRMPVGTQNFKYIPWTAIAETLNLE